MNFHRFCFAFSLSTGLVFAPSLALAHEGHALPGSVQPPKGGMVRSSEHEIYEVLARGKTISIYVYDHDLKPKPAKSFPIVATTTLPRKKASPLALTAREDHWEGTFDAQGAHRYTLELEVKSAGHTDRLKYTIEPKK